MTPETLARFVRTTNDKLKPVAVFAEVYRNRKGMRIQFNYIDADLSEEWEANPPKTVEDAEILLNEHKFARIPLNP